MTRQNTKLYSQIKAAYDKRSAALFQEDYEAAQKHHTDLLKLHAELLEQSPIDRSFPLTIIVSGILYIRQVWRGRSATYVPEDKYDPSRYIVEPAAALDYILSEEEQRIECLEPLGVL